MNIPNIETVACFSDTIYNYVWWTGSDCGMYQATI